MLVVVLTLLLPLLDDLITYLLGLASLAPLTPAQRTLLASSFKRMSKCSDQANRLGLPFNGDEVQNAP